MAEQLPVWNAVGVEPPTDLKTNGWKAGDKPPADYMNWLFNRINACLTELQTGVGDVAQLEQDLATLQQAVSLHQEDGTAHVPYAVATGSANTYAVTLDPAPTSYVDGMAITVKINVQNTGASTINVNGLGAKSIKKSNGNDVASGNLKAGVPYTLRYNGTNFILQGEGGEYGTATAPQVLSGYSIGTEDGLVNGTMPNNGAVNQSLAANGTYTIPAGYHSGTGKVTQSLTNKGAQTYTPGTANQTIAANQYLTGIQTILGDADLIASNIRSGKNIFGVAGNLVPVTTEKKMASGTVSSGSTTSSAQYLDSTSTASKYSVTVSGLTFKPSLILINSGFTGAAYFTLYAPNLVPDLQAEQVFVLQRPTKWVYDAELLAAKANVNGFYVNATGFKLPVEYQNHSWTWVAYE